MRTTLVIVDDHADFRAAAGAMLEAAGFDVVGEAADGASAVAAIQRLRPQVALLDIVLPDTDGFSVCERFATVSESRPQVVLTSSRDAASYGSRISRCGARGFVSKADLTGPTLWALLG